MAISDPSEPIQKDHDKHNSASIDGLHESIKRIELKLERVQEHNASVNNGIDILVKELCKYITSIDAKLNTINSTSNDSQLEDIRNKVDKHHDFMMDMFREVKAIIHSLQFNQYNPHYRYQQPYQQPNAGYGHCGPSGYTPHQTYHRSQPPGDSDFNEVTARVGSMVTQIQSIFREIDEIKKAISSR